MFVTGNISILLNMPAVLALQVMLGMLAMFATVKKACNAGDVCLHHQSMQLLVYHYRLGKIVGDRCQVLFCIFTAVP